MNIIDQAHGEKWSLFNADSCELLPDMPGESVDLMVFSPPFGESLYTYCDSERDIGNCRTVQEFMEHFRFVVRELFRILRPGRICAVHVMDIPAMLVRDGFIGLKDFSGDVLRLFIEEGWVWDARIPIDKNQQAQSIRTHSKALTMTQFEKDRTWLRPALPDYILKFRKPGVNGVPVRGEMTRDLWIEWANPTWPGEEDRCLDRGAFATWYGIEETKTLNAAVARSNADERHICPLQIQTIERCVRLWSNRGEVVMSPFAGIGSELYVSRQHERSSIGIELKPEYFGVAVRNLRQLDEQMRQPNLFSALGEEAA